MKSVNSDSNLTLEQKLWLTADKLRSNMDAAEYKHVVLGLIFLKYISDAFEEKQQKLIASNDDPEDRDCYSASDYPNKGDKAVFFVPPKARWSYLQNNAKNPTIGKFIDDAMHEIEKDNPKLKGVLSKDYARPTLDKVKLGELIDLIGTIALGDSESKAKDLLGRTYEYFLGQFASAEGKKGGQFYTPRCIVQLLVEMLEPYHGRIYDPCCGSGGMFIQSEKFVEAHGGKINDISVYGQESNPTTWRLCKMNLAIRGIEENIGDHAADTFHNDLHKDLKADFIIANPPFNISDWGGEQLQNDVRWKYGIPPKGNANFGWVQHMIHHLSPYGVAGFVLANGSMSSNTSGEGQIRKNILEADLVDCIVALPGQLFYNTAIPACLWFLARDKKNHKFRDRRGEVLFIDARKLGVMIDRAHKELKSEEVSKISAVYHAWRGEGEKYMDVQGFCKSVKLEEISKHDYILTPGRYVGSEEEEEDAEPFDEKMQKLTTQLAEQFKKSHELETQIKNNLKGIGYDFTY